MRILSLCSSWVVCSPETRVILRSAHRSASSGKRPLQMGSRSSSCFTIHWRCRADAGEIRRLVYACTGGRVAVEPPLLGSGICSRAAGAAIEDGFVRVGLAEIVTMTALSNIPSRRVMERLGMAPSTEFDHPHHPEGSPLRRPISYGCSSHPDAIGVGNPPFRPRSR
jgi:hypothetical protein